MFPIYYEQYAEVVGLLVRKRTHGQRLHPARADDVDSGLQDVVVGEACWAPHLLSRGDRLVFE